MSVPRSYFLIKSTLHTHGEGGCSRAASVVLALLRFSHTSAPNDDALEAAYRAELDANSHFASSEETFADYRLYVRLLASLSSPHVAAPLQVHWTTARCVVRYRGRLHQPGGDQGECAV